MRRHEKHPMVYAASGLLLGSFAITACGGDTAVPEEKKFCRSDRYESVVYPGDTTSGVTDKDQRTRKQGLTLLIEFPEDRTDFDLVVGYRHPSAAEWKDSKPLDAGLAHNGMLVKLGRGAVIFSVLKQAPEGSPACDRIQDQMPVVTIAGPEPLQSIPTTGPNSVVSPDWP